jgi:hypothetical protein
MRYSELAGGRRLGALGAAAGICISLTACGASAGSTPGQTARTTPVISASTQKFCKEVATAMASLAGTNPSESMKLTVARKTLDSLLDNGIKSFTKLEPEAPANLRNSIKTIVADFKSYKVTASKAKSTKELLGETIAASPMEKAAYQQLLGYTGTSC